MTEICKNYKPEILSCPICCSKLIYRHAVSNKLVYFTSGKRVRIKNLGYSCPKCLDNKIYASQTANKLSFSGYTYSVKIVCTIAVLKENHKNRDQICDYFYNKNINMSDRNVDNLYHKYLEFSNLDYKTTIFKAYEVMLEKYNQIRLSIDVVSVSDSVFIIIYDFFNLNVLALKRFKDLRDERLVEFFKEILNKDLKITVIASIRKDAYFIPLLKSICPSTTKFIAFNKF